MTLATAGAMASAPALTIDRTRLIAVVEREL
jgi:hypothetical protein